MKLKTRSAGVASTSSTATSKMLAVWLREQASRLRSLEAEGNRLKMAIVLNAKQQGEILIDVRKRLADNSQSFKQWVDESTDIGYSTSLLWIDIAEHYEDLKKRFADSNLLELTIRQIRDLIRDLRQERGIGKPGSGRKKPTETPNPDSGELEYSDNDAQTWEREVAAAEAEAAVYQSGDKTEVSTQYKMTVTVFTVSDQAVLQQALSEWSPVCTPVANSKQARSVTVKVDLEQIGDLLATLGTTLQQCRPQKVRVSIER